MNLDNLISKYLDGELTIEEDKELRKLLAEDPLAKETFDEFVEMNFLVKEDAHQIKTPEDLKSSTEDKILMRILSNSTDNGMMYPEAKEQKSNRRILVPLFVFLIGFFAIINIDFVPEDAQLAIPKANLIMELPDMEQIKNEISASSINEVEVNNTTTSQNEEAIVTEPVNIDQVASFSISNSESVINANDNLIIESESFASDNNEEINSNNDKSFVVGESSSAPVISISNTDLFTSDLSLSNRNSNLIGVESGKIGLFTSDRIIVSSNAGNEVFRNGFDPSSADRINNFNQSISLKLDDNKRVGVEIGFQDYTFNQLNRVILDYDGGYNPDMEGQIIGTNKISTLVETTQNYRRAWAMVYLDNRLFNYRSFDLFSRVGLGASQDGPMFAGNLYLEYEIFNGLGLTAGLDMRLFDADYSRFVGQTSGYKFNTNFVYGLNFSF